MAEESLSEILDEMLPSTVHIFIPRTTGEARRLQYANEMYQLIEEFALQLRNLLKYENLSEETAKEIEKLRSFLHTGLEDRGIDLDLLGVS